MRIETLYDQGAVKIPEDRIIVRLPFVGVADGVSGLYLPSEGPILFKGQSGGQMASAALLETVAATREDQSLEDLLIRANQKIKQAQEDLGYYTSGQVERLAGCAFALAKIGEEKIEIIQCADAFALWVTANQRVGITPNQIFNHDMEMRRIIAELMEKHRGDRQKMWEELTPILTEMRRQHINKQTEDGYGLLNGQSEATELWQRFALRRKELSLLLLFTDGLVYYPESGDEQTLAQKVLRLFKEGGLRAILRETRRLEEEEKQASHIDHAEASAVVIEF